MPIEALAEAVRWRYVFVLGKGGVGKTTISILLALALSRRGRALVASLDPAKHLLEYLSLKRVGTVERVTGNLYAVQYDVDSRARRVAEELELTLKKLMPGLSVLNLDHVLKTIRDAPGFEEEVMLSIVQEIYGLDYDYVVIDTPPTGVALRVLALPRLYLNWVRGLRELRESIVSVKYAIARALGRPVKPSDPVLEKLGELEKRYTRLYNLLRDGRLTGYVAVATPEPLPVYEVEVIASKLRDLGMKLGLVIANRVLGEKAAELGVGEVEERSLSRLKEIACRARARMVVVRHAGFAPKSLDDVARLAEEAVEGLVDPCG